MALLLSFPPPPLPAFCHRCSVHLQFKCGMPYAGPMLVSAKGCTQNVAIPTPTACFSPSNIPAKIKLMENDDQQPAESLFDRE